MREIETELSGAGLRIGIVVSRFNHLLTRRLLDACSVRLEELGCSDVDVLWVPGAFEIPVAAQAAARSGRYAAVIAIGVVIRGDTPHFDYVCRAVTDGVRDVGLRFALPVVFCVLTTDTVEQALERSAAPGEPGANKGVEAAEAAVEMAALLRCVGSEVPA